ncbi:TPA: membrane lipoprotein lipid attachment site-containing protein [Bacillus cereus]|nr:membrane lipoprotein lipid attachment site-containing protein [Bacillus cereus]
MKKLIFFLLCIVFILTGCNSSNVENEKEHNISKVSISTFIGYGGLNENYFLNIEDKQIIDGINNMFNDMKKQKRRGEIPQYDILITYENSSDTKGIHLYLGDEGERSVIMYIGHENTAYYTSKETTKQLRKIIVKKD